MTASSQDRKYDVIVGDPPWSFKKWSGKKSRTADSKYHVMTPQQILDLPVQDIAAANSVLHLWVPCSQTPLGIDVLKAWGYRWVTIVWNWMKVDKDGNPVCGMGSHSRCSSEICLLGVKGKGLPRVDRSQRQGVLSSPGEHSAKPVEVMDRIVKLYGPDVSKIELFSRGRLCGWTAWGDEANLMPIEGDVVDSMWGSKLVTPGPVV